MHESVGRFARLLALLLLASLAAPPARAVPAYPPSRVEVVRDTLHGTVVEDPYRWLEAARAPETRAWIEAQNRYRDSVMSAAPDAAPIRARLCQLLRVDAASTPMARGDRYFFRRRRADQDLDVLVVRQGPDGTDRVLADPHPLSPDHSKSVTLMDVTPDGRLAAIGTREGGADELEIAFRDVDTGADLPDRMPRMRYYGMALAPDHRGLWYSRFTPEGPRVLWHPMGGDPARDEVVFGGDLDPQKLVSLSLSEDGRTLVATVLVGSSGQRSEIWVKDASGDAPFRPLIRGLDAYFGAIVVGDRAYVRTNWKAPRNRIVRVDLADPAPGRWTEVVPQGTGVIESFSLAGGRLFANVLEDVASKIRVYSPDGKALGTIQFPALGTVGGISGRWDSDEAFFTFSSWVTPTTIYRYDVARGTRSTWWRPSTPVAPEAFETKQAWYRSKDGTRVPMFLVHRKGLRLDGSHPAYLTGYGGFNASMTPSFTATAVVWAENGGVFAVPALRGGGEFGQAWHEAGMRERKQNVFDDFLAAAEWLVKSGYTRPDRLAIEGGSNGGLLVGAALTQRPELFRAVVCEYPLLDMLRYQKFSIARLWVPEYGSSDDPRELAWLRAYSPYQNVRPGTAYPAVLFVTGDGDTRVDPLHARKMTALLQSATGSDRPILLDYDTQAGHTSSGRPVGKRIEDMERGLRFLFWQLGMDPTQAQSSAAR